MPPGFGFFGAFAMIDEVPVRYISPAYHIAIGVMTRQRISSGSTKKRLPDLLAEYVALRGEI